MRTHINDAFVPSQAKIRSDRPGPPDTRLHGSRLILARVVWIAAVTLLVAFFLAMLPAYYTLLQTTCTGARCGIVQPTPGFAQAIQKLGFSVSSYATFTLALVLALAIVCFSVSSVIFWRKSDDWMALLVALGVVALVTVNVTNVLQVRDSPWQVLAIVLNVLGLGMVFLIGLLFPNGRFVPRWTHWLLFCWLLTGIVYLFFRDVSFMYQVYNLAVFAALVLVSIALFYRYHFASSPPQRQQTKWVIFGICVAGIIVVGLKILTFLFPSLGQAGSFYQLMRVPANIVAVLIVPICLGLAILRYRLWDIDLIIRRTLVYGMLTVLLALIYFGLVIALQSLVQLLTGTIAGQPLVIVASTLAIAALFQPLRRRIQRMIDRRFYRRKYDAVKTLAAFSATLRDEVDLSRLREQLVAVVEETMQPAYVSLWLCAPTRSSEKTTRVLPSIDPLDKA